MKDKNKSWVSISCQCKVEDSETCSWIFFQNGAEGIEVENLDDQTIFIKASFSQVTFDKDGGIQNFCDQFAQFGMPEIGKALKLETIANENWMSNWRKHFQPFAVGDTLIICPPWKENNIQIEQIEKKRKVIIDPGMAFGTGLHSTTRFCLEIIEKLDKGKHILDVGTGSGILAITCALVLPGSNILAIDTDSQAIENAKHNIELNNVQEQICLSTQGPNDVCADSAKNNWFDVVLSNLTVEDIMAFMPIYNKLLAANGILILAGIIEERLSELENCLALYKLELFEKRIVKGWAGLALTKIGS